MKRFYIVLIVFLLVLSVASVTNAGRPTPNFTFNSVQACEDNITIAYDYSDDPATSFDVTIADAGGTIFNNPTAPATQGTNIVVNFAYPAQSSGELLTITFKYNGLRAPDEVTNATVVSCGGEEVEINGCFATDGRIAANDCAAPFAAYLTQDADGWFLQIWIINPDSTGTHLLSLFEEGATGTGIIEDDGITILRMADGTLQIIMPYPKQPNKLYILVINPETGDFDSFDIELPLVTNKLIN